MKEYNNTFANGFDHSVNIFDNPGEFGAWLEDHAPKASLKFPGNDFYSNSGWQDVKAGMVAGDATVAERASKIMQQIDAGLPATPKRKRVVSPYGRANVGAYLASDPMPCRRVVKVKHETAPISIVASLNSMASVPARHLEARGVVIAALVRRLVASRPVNLYLSRFSNVNGDASSCVLVKFPTAPIDSYRLAYLLSNQGFCRGAGFAFHEAKAGKQGDVYFAGDMSYSQSRHCQYARDLETLLGHEVFYIPGSDPKQTEFKKMTSNPVAWLNETVRELTRARED